MSRLSVSVAQTLPIKGDVDANVAEHVAMLEAAAGHGATATVFPELSVTGYELELADGLAFRPGDSRLEPIRDAARRTGATAIVGAPLRLDSGLHIGAFALLPDGEERRYTKHHVHASESAHFVSGTVDPRVELAGESAALAICADTTFESHARSASESGAGLYLAGSFLTPEGHGRDAALLESYARQLGLFVAMANFGGPSGGLTSGGRSSIWQPGGRLVARAGEAGRALVVAERRDGEWHGDVFEF